MNKVTLYDIFIFCGFNSEDADRFTECLDSLVFSVSELVEFIDEYALMVGTGIDSVSKSLIESIFYVVINGVSYRIRQFGELYEIVKI